jgi:hypothetical protein
MFLIDTRNKKAVPLEKKTFSELNLSERKDLQEWIADNPYILGERLLIIQKEFAGFSDTKERLDLLALDENGKLVIIENKLDDSGKDVTWQALKYVSYCAALTKAEICDIYQKFMGEGSIAEEKLSEFFDEPDYESIKLNPVDGDQRIIFVAANFRKEVTSTVLWLRDHGIDITCIKVTPYLDGEKLYLDVEQILPIQDIGDYQIKLSAKKQEDIVSSNEEASRHKLRRKFWEKAIPILRAKTGMYSNVSPTKDNWITGASGHSGITYNPVILMDGARAELYIDTGDYDRNKRIFNSLYEKKDEFDAKLGLEAYWREIPDKRASIICISNNDNGLIDEEHWDDVINFLASSIMKLKEVFKTPLDAASKG